MRNRVAETNPGSSPAVLVIIRRVSVPRPTGRPTLNHAVEGGCVVFVGNFSRGCLGKGGVFGIGGLTEDEEEGHEERND